MAIPHKLALRRKLPLHDDAVIFLVDEEIELKVSFHGLLLLGVLLTGCLDCRTYLPRSRAGPQTSALRPPGSCAQARTSGFGRSSWNGSARFLPVPARVS